MKTFMTELMGPRHTGQWPLGCLRMVLAQSRQVWRWAQGRISPLRTLFGSMHTTQAFDGSSWEGLGGRRTLEFETAEAVEKETDL